MRPRIARAPCAFQPILPHAAGIAKSFLAINVVCAPERCFRYSAYYAGLHHARTLSIAGTICVRCYHLPAKRFVARTYPESARSMSRSDSVKQYQLCLLMLWCNPLWASYFQRKLSLSGCIAACHPTLTSRLLHGRSPPSPAAPLRCSRGGKRTVAMARRHGRRLLLAAASSRPNVTPDELSSMLLAVDPSAVT